jgi:hypothetical protein
MKYSLFVAGILMFMTSCAALPNADKVKGFGEAAASSSSAMKDALSSNRTIALRTSREREAVAYMTGRPYFLRMNDADRKLILEAKEQVAVLSALENYAKALVKAADQGVISDLEAASSRLTTAAGNTASLLSPGSAPVIGPAFKVSGRLIGLGLGNAYAMEIQAILRTTDPTVQAIAKNMPASLEAVAVVVGAQAEGFEVQRQITLDTVLRDRKVDRLALYKEYMMARSDVETVETQVKALSGSVKVFSQLAEAHGALAAGSSDAAILVKNFSATATDLAELIKAVRQVEGQ